MSPSWLLWYGLHVGLSYETAMMQPIGLILDLAYIDMIKTGMAKRKTAQSEDEEIIPPDAI